MIEKLKCSKCGGSLTYLAGESAHPSNWYCDTCDGVDVEPQQTKYLKCDKPAKWSRMCEECYNDMVTGVGPGPIKIIPDNTDQALRDEVAMRLFLAYTVAGYVSDAAKAAMIDADIFMWIRAEDIERRKKK